MTLYANLLVLLFKANFELVTTQSNSFEDIVYAHFEQGTISHKRLALVIQEIVLIQHEVAIDPQWFTSEADSFALHP